MVMLLLGRRLDDDNLHLIILDMMLPKVDLAHSLAIHDQLTQTNRRCCNCHAQTETPSNRIFCIFQNILNHKYLVLNQVVEIQKVKDLYPHMAQDHEKHTPIKLRGCKYLVNVLDYLYGFCRTKNV
ncbi:hypothetical protein Ccrd_016851, partial [Cynara cardunculus var. scolymus]